MTLPERESRKIVIAGASSLLGAELRSLLEESRFADWDFHLVDDDVVAGKLTEAGGEAVVIQAVEEGTFARAKFVFFAGSSAFTRAHAASAKDTGTRIIDLSGGLASEPGTRAWFPKLDRLLGREFAKEGTVFAVPSAAGEAAATLTLAIEQAGGRNISIIAFQPVSEAGRAGIEELESQTGQLLSFQGVGQPVFDTQVAFNLLDRYGPGSAIKLDAVRERVRIETRACLASKAEMPAIQVLHAPVFYGTAFAASATFGESVTGEQIVKACEEAGCSITGEDGNRPSNVSAAGEKTIQLARPERDAAQMGTWWFWGAADNIRLPAANAVRLAEMLS